MGTKRAISQGVTTPLKLPPSLDIRGVAGLLEPLRVHLATVGAEIDGTDVERCDTAGAQLLVAAARAGKAQWRFSEALWAG